MFLGQSVTARRNWKKREESVWSGTYSRYHVLRFLSFTTTVLPNIRCQCSSRNITVWNPPSTHTFPFNKNGETVVGVRGTHDEMIQRLMFWGLSLHSLH